MSEWFKEHAWKAKRGSSTKRVRSTLTHRRSATLAFQNDHSCASVNLNVFRVSSLHLGRNDEVCFVRPRQRSRVTAFGDDAWTSPQAKMEEGRWRRSREGP